MGDILGIIILVIFYAVAINATNKNKKKKNAQQSVNKTRDARFDQAFGTESRSQKKRPSRRVEREEHTAQPLERPAMHTQLEWDLEHAQEGEDPCHGESPRREGDWRRAQPGMRLKPVTQADMAYAAEGEDPCHTGGLEIPEHDPVYDSPIYAPVQDTEALARQVLSGVIMSEVLKRPAERRAERKLRRGA